MSCNCATNKQIQELYRKYGEKSKIKKGDGFRANAKKVIYAIGVYLAMIPITPILFLFVAYKALYTDDKQISVSKMFRLDKHSIANVGEQ